ncbi:MAG: hypothetical protein ABR574_00560 [Cryomorphaceae bacterium]|nr:hypothetical protein [Flavobacteriales bacterium]
MLILLSSFAAFGQEVVKVGNKTLCDADATVQWSDSQGNPVGTTNVTVNANSFWTFNIPSGYFMCKFFLDVPGGVQDEFKIYGSLSGCSALNSESNSNCYNYIVTDVDGPEYFIEIADI